MNCSMVCLSMVEVFCEEEVCSRMVESKPNQRALIPRTLKPTKSVIPIMQKTLNASFIFITFLSSS